MLPFPWYTIADEPCDCEVEGCNDCDDWKKSNKSPKMVRDRETRILFHQIKTTTKDNAPPGKIVSVYVYDGK